MKKIIAGGLSVITACSLCTGMLVPVAAAEKSFAGEKLSILVSAGWMDNRYDGIIERFEDEYDVTVDLQSVPADQYLDVLKSKLSSNTCADIFWIQSNPFAIQNTLVHPEDYCIDFTGAEWKDVIPEERLASCMSDDKLYGLQLWQNSPEYVMVYNKTLFESLELGIPKTYDDLKDVCEKISGEGIIPWFIPGADGWREQLAFFQIGGVYEQAKPGLYEGLNNNTEKFAGNETMELVLKQFKELSDAGYFGEDWISEDSTGMSNMLADRETAMVMENPGYINEMKEETGAEDEFGIFLIPLADNQTYPTNPAGPIMLGNKNTSNIELVKEWFSFVTKQENIQDILDRSPDWTNIHVNEEIVKIEQRWLDIELELLEQVDDTLRQTPVLQTGTKYTNSYWNDFGSDMIAYCMEQMELEQILQNMDESRAESAKLQGDPAWN